MNQVLTAHNIARSGHEVLESALIKMLDESYRGKFQIMVYGLDTNSVAGLKLPNEIEPSDREKIIEGFKIVCAEQQKNPLLDALKNQNEELMIRLGALESKSSQPS